MPAPSAAAIADDVATASRLLNREFQFVATLPGGEHARTSVITDGTDEYVARRFPIGDNAVDHEVGVLGLVQGLGSLVPQLVGADGGTATSAPLIVTTRVPGHPPLPGLPPTALAQQMGTVLARIHGLNGAGLRRAPVSAPSGTGRFAATARARFGSLPSGDRVLTHYDFWCGNTLWVGDRLSGVIDWSGARHAPRGQDLAWCRLDLILMGHVEASDVFLDAYEQAAGASVWNIAEWDFQAVAQAEDDVETWRPNYAGIGLTSLTAARLRERLTEWGDSRLHLLMAL